MPKFGVSEFVGLKTVLPKTVFPKLVAPNRCSRFLGTILLHTLGF